MDDFIGYNKFWASSKFVICKYLTVSLKMQMTCWIIWLLWRKNDEKLGWTKKTSKSKTKTHTQTTSSITERPDSQSTPPCGSFSWKIQACIPIICQSLKKVNYKNIFSCMERAMLIFATDVFYVIQIYVSYKLQVVLCLHCVYNMATIWYFSLFGWTSCLQDV